MLYLLTFHKSFYADFARLPRDIQKRIEKVDAELRDRPVDQHGGNIKKLDGFRHLWRYRLGSFRLVYAVFDDVVEMLFAGPRKDVYERLRYDSNQPDELLLSHVEAELFPDRIAPSSLIANTSTARFRVGRLFDRWTDNELLDQGLTSSELNLARKMDNEDELWAYAGQVSVPAFEKLRWLLHPSPRSTVFTLPPMIARLVDRREEYEEQLVQCLIREDAPLICLLGSRGIGKSALVAWAISQFRYAYLWLACNEQPDVTLTTLLAGIRDEAAKAHQVGLLSLGDSEEDQIRAAIEFLNETDRLLVFQNYDALDDSHSIDIFIAEAARKLGRLRIILTARHLPVFLTGQDWPPGVVRHIPVRGLPVNGYADLWESINPNDKLSLQDVRKVWFKYAGNPSTMIKFKDKIRDHHLRGNLEALPPFSENWISDMLTVEARFVAERLSAAGLRLQRRLINRLCPEPTSSKWIGELIDKGVLKGVDPETYLMDDSARNLLYAEMDGGAKAHAHSDAGDCFASMAEESHTISERAEYLFQAIRHFEQSGSNHQALLRIAPIAYDLLSGRGDWDRARFVADTALEAARLEQDKAGEITWLLSLAERSIDREQFTDAEEFLIDAATCISKVVDGSAEKSAQWRAHHIRLIVQKGRLAYRQTPPDYDLATSHYKAALDIVRQSGERDVEAQCLFRIGQVERRRGKKENLEQSKTKFAEALRMASEIGNTDLVFECVSHLGVVTTKQGNWERVAKNEQRAQVCFREASQYYQTAFQLAMKKNDRLAEEETRSHIGRLAQQVGELAKAEGLLRSSLSIARDIRNLRGIRIELTRLIDVLIALGKHDEARSLLDESEQRNLEARDDVGIAWNLKHRGQLQKAQGHIEDGNHLIRQGIQKVREIRYEEFIPEFESALN